jgi:photosystem II stability/assembly factor-like uncharacterized protein
VPSVAWWRRLRFLRPGAKRGSATRYPVKRGRGVSQSGWSRSVSRLARGLSLTLLLAGCAVRSASPVQLTPVESSTPTIVDTVTVPPTADPPTGTPTPVPSTLTPATPRAAASPSQTPTTATSSRVPPSTLPRLAGGYQVGIEASFVDPDHGWLAADTSILATSDGGKTWNRISELSKTIDLLDFVSLRDGWAATEDGLLVTNDGGTTWTLSAPSKTFAPFQSGELLPYLSRLDLLDPLHGWATVDHQGLVRTADGGKTWTTLSDPCPHPLGKLPEGPFHFISPNVGWILCWQESVAAGTRLLNTTDGGQTWQIVAESDRSPASGLPGVSVIQALSFADTTTGWISTMSALYATDDGGHTWRVVVNDASRSAPLSLDGIHSVQILSPGQGYVVLTQDDRSGLLITRDNGVTWTQIYPPASSPGLRPCRAADLSASAGWQGATQSLMGSVIVTNRSASVCALDRNAQIQLTSAAEKPLPIPITFRDGSNVSPTVSLSPGGRASMSFIGYWCQPDPSVGFRVVVILPNDRNQIFASIPKQPSYSCVPERPVGLTVNHFEPLDPPVSVSVPSPAPKPSSGSNDRCSAPSHPAPAAGLCPMARLSYSNSF